MAKAPTNFWTNSNIKALPPTAKNPNSDHIVWHPKIERFGVRFLNGKPTSYVIMYFLGGRDRKYTLGKVNQISFDQGADLAEGAFNGLRQIPPIDPALASKTQRAVHDDRFIDFVQPFLDAQKADGLSDTWLHTQTAQLLGVTNKITNKFQPAYFACLHNTPPKLIDGRQVAEALNEITKARGQIATRAARATLSKFFKFMGHDHIVDSNPVLTTRNFQSIAIERTLSVDELRIVWNACNPTTRSGRIVRNIILTGTRKSQIGGLRKVELDLDGSRNRWGVPMITLERKPSLRQRKAAAANGGELKRRRGGSKNNLTFHIPLSPQAVELLKLENSPNPAYVFGDGPDTQGFSGWSNAMDDIYEAIGDRITEHWTLQDLRRTFSTICVEDKRDGGLDLDATAVDACINHKPEELKKGTRGIYQYAKLLRKRIEVMNQWGAFIEELGRPPKPDLRIVDAA
jgi:integrase